MFPIPWLISTDMDSQSKGSLTQGWSAVLSCWRKPQTRNWRLQCIFTNYTSGLMQWPSWLGTVLIHPIKLPSPAEWPCPSGLSKITPDPCSLHTAMVQMMEPQNQRKFSDLVQSLCSHSPREQSRRQKGRHWDISKKYSAIKWEDIKHYCQE